MDEQGGPAREPALIRLMLVEDHELTRLGLRALLGANLDFSVMSEARSGEEALELRARTEVDVALMDINLPGMDGIQAAQELRRRWPGTQVMMLTASNRRDQVLAALASGAMAYCLKSASVDVIHQGVRSAASGGVFFDPQSARLLLGSVDSGVMDGGMMNGGPALTPLSERELTVLRLVSDGRGNREIAERLGVSVGLVKQEIGSILEKLQATDRTQAAVRAFRTGLI